MLKKLKIEANASSPVILPPPPGSHNGGLPSRKATLEEVQDEDSDFAPGRDADYFVEEDEEGRFFGGGLTSEQKEILNIFERAEGDDTGEEVSFELPETAQAKLRQAFRRYRTYLSLKFGSCCSPSNVLSTKTKTNALNILMILLSTFL